MSHISLVVGAFVLASGVWQQPPPFAAPASGHLRWVRGSVTEISPASLTVQLSKKTLTLVLDANTRFLRPAADTSAARPSVGSVIDVHYVDKKPGQRAVAILSDPLGTAKPRWIAGHSYRGVITRIKNRDVDVRVDTKNRRVKFIKNSQVTGVDGQSLAIGYKAGPTQLSVGEEILVTWNQNEDDFEVLEIRKLPPSPLGS